MSTNGKQAPPAGEELHMPAPSVLPLLVAVALTIFLLGLTKSVFVWAGGAILLVALIVRWIADSRREHQALPAHHE